MTKLGPTHHHHPPTTHPLWHRPLWPGQAAQLQDPVMSSCRGAHIISGTQRGGDRGHSCCGHLLSSSPGPGCRRQGDMSSVQQFCFPLQTSSGPAAVAGGGRPSTTTTRVHSDTSGTDRGLLNGHYFDSLDTCLHQNINSIKTHLPLQYLLYYSSLNPDYYIVY